MAEVTVIQKEVPVTDTKTVERIVVELDAKEKYALKSLLHAVTGYDGVYEKGGASTEAEKVLKELFNALPGCYAGRMFRIQRGSTSFSDLRTAEFMGLE